jgi:DNA-binding beta-propeller fold protein YncE
VKNNPLATDRVIGSFGAKGTGQGLFQDPRSIAVGANGDIFVADYSTGRVQRFDAQGNFLSLWLLGDETIITAMDAGPDGVVYVAYEGDIHRFDDASGSQLGLLPNPENRYYEDIRVMADGGLAVVADGETLMRFDPRGELAWIVEDAVSTASGDSELDARVAADGLGNLYLLGAFNDGVFKFDPQGRFVTRWGSAGEEDGQFRATNAIAVDGQGRVYVSDIRGIHVFENDGRYARTIRDIGVAFGMDFDSQGQLWIATNAPKVFAYQVGQ